MAPKMNPRQIITKKEGHSELLTGKYSVVNSYVDTWLTPPLNLDGSPVSLVDPQEQKARSRFV